MWIEIEDAIFKYLIWPAFLLAGVVSALLMLAVIVVGAYIGITYLLGS